MIEDYDAYYRGIREIDACLLCEELCRRGQHELARMVARHDFDRGKFPMPEYAPPHVDQEKWSAYVAEGKRRQEFLATCSKWQEPKP